MKKTIKRKKGDFVWFNILITNRYSYSQIKVDKNIMNQKPEFVGEMIIKAMKNIT